MRGMALAVVLLLAGCGSGERKQTIVTDDGKAEITTRDDGQATTIKVKGAEGADATFSAGGNSKWPQQWPDFAPAYPAAKVQVSMAGGGKEGQGGMVTFTTADSPEKVVDFYRDKATAAGLKPATSVESGETRQFSAKDEATKRSLSVSVSRDGGESTVMVMAGVGR